MLYLEKDILSDATILYYVGRAKSRAANCQFQNGNWTSFLEVSLMNAVNLAVAFPGLWAVSVAPWHFWEAGLTGGCQNWGGSSFPAFGNWTCSVLCRQLGSGYILQSWFRECDAWNVRVCRWGKPSFRWSKPSTFSTVTCEDEWPQASQEAWVLYIG